MVCEYSVVFLLRTGLTNYISHFYYKIGACRHGDKCSKRHARPHKSHTVIIYNMVNFPAEGMSYEDFDALYEDIYTEACNFGPVRSMVICENSNVHLKGNVYFFYEKEQDAQDAKDAFNTRWYDERPLYSDLTHISDFREAICRKHDMGTCERGGDCNFMHVKRPSTKLRIELEKSQAKKWQTKQ